MPINWNQEQPAPKELRGLLKNTFPEIKLKVPDGKGGMMINYQIYIVRNVAGSNNASDHSEGRAIDIYLEAGDTGEKKIADYLYQVFINSADDMGISYVIWNREWWKKSTGQKEPYTGSNPHTNHIHVSWSRDGSQKIILGSVPAQLMLRVGFPGSAFEKI
jgi:hypothetical protein